jgi:aspartyl-tRNA(Asn)/glutamyl-tRNA(Gln) amidotransferase subunit C
VVNGEPVAGGAGAARGTDVMDRARATHQSDGTDATATRGSVSAVELDDATMAHLQRLARLELAPEEVGSVREDLRSLLAYVDQLQSADVDDVEPTARPVPPDDKRRDDVPAEPLPQAQALRLAPASKDGFVRVPRTVEEG